MLSGMSGRRHLCVVMASVSAAIISTVVATGPASAATQTAHSSDNQAVIVLMRAQHPDLKPKIQARQRQQAVNADQAGVVADLRGHGATHIQQLDTVSAVAATANQSEIDHIAANPQVLAVVPDRTIPRPALPAAVAGPTHASGGGALCTSDPAKPLLEPEALGLTHTASADPKVPSAQSLATGKGVKIAFMAEGIDINNPDFIRPDGSHVFFDYQDFSGDGINDDSGGEEAFGDASSLAAQGNRVYDLSTALPNAGLPSGCTFRIRGFAPGASLAAIKVFGQFGTTESAFVRGIDYAVNTDKVDVLSQSFGGFTFPDGAVDPLSIADEAAIAAGVTVVASSGDSGQTGTVGSPASAPDVIAAAGSTSYRLNAMAKGYPGFVSDNVTGLSSGGPTLDNKYVDLLAPGMTGMAECTVNPALFDCSQSTQVFGGTSQAAPFVAGAAALVIQAYEQTHGGTRPAPALVRQLLDGTATDLNAPSDQQGAGLLNSYAAVRAAEAVGTKSSSGNALLPSSTQLDLVGAANSTQRVSETLTNTSRKPQTVVASSRELGRQTFSASTSEQVTAGGPPTGGPGEDAVAAPEFHFTVPSGTPWLNAEMAWPGTSTSGQLVFELFDPAGRLVQESYDFGFTDFQHIGVHNPTPGRWTEKVLWGNGRGHFQEPLETPGTFRGQVALRITGNQYTSAGVHLVSKVIQAGRSATFALSVPMPGQAGDAPAAVQFDSNLGTHLSVPLARRVLIPTSKNSSFAATISGGVGRGLNQYLGYNLDVPGGKQNLTVNLVAPDPATEVQFFLVSPEGQILSGDTNAVETAWNSGTSTPTGTESMTVDKPQAGRWQLIALLAGASSGKEFSVRASGLPNSSATVSHPVAGSVTVTNTSNAGAFFFLDPRLNAQTDVTLPPVDGDTTIDLPEDTATTSPPDYLVPPHTSGLAQTVDASTEVDAYLEYGQGNPGAYHTVGDGHGTLNAINARQLAFGGWITDIGQIGPFPNGAPPATATISLQAHMQPFDTGLTSGTGDFWLTSVGGSSGQAVFIPAGGTASIPVTVAPTAAAGTVVSGTVYVDTWNNVAGQGSELTGIPYRYTVG
jgi:Subtilase family